MANSLGVGQVAEWFKATVLKDHPVTGLNCQKPRISNRKQPRRSRQSRLPERFALAHLPAHVARRLPCRGNDELTVRSQGARPLADQIIDHSLMPSTIDEWIDALTVVDTGNIDCVHIGLRQYIADQVTPEGWLKTPCEMLTTPLEWAKWSHAFDFESPLPWKGTGYTPQNMKWAREQYELQQLEPVEIVKAPQLEGAACLYFIGADEGPIKIGVSQNVEARLKQLQTGYPHKLLLLAHVQSGSAMEPEYHARFAAHRLQGEWFVRAPEILAEIETLALSASMEQPL